MDRRDLAKVALGGTATLAAAFYSVPAMAQALGPVLVVITHPVADYAAFRAVYDDSASVRDAAGVTGAEVFVDPTDPNMIVVLHRFPSMEAAQGFMSNPDLAAAMQRGGLTASPTVIFGIAT